jgi:serine/threonine protein kinase
MSEMRLGDYVLLRKLATGGMAEIWLGQKAGPAGFSKQVVIKKILPHLAEDEKFVEMFLDEARLAAQLEHPNIVQIFDLGERDGSYFIAMEFIDGCDLEAIMARANAVGRPLPPSFVARVMADACTALDYAHHFRDASGREAHLVHRDISPQNLLVSRTGVVKVVDFGVAKAATSSHKTQTGAVKGKLSYMSPEQITAKPLDGRSDIFALGIVLYELLTGMRPFGHDSELLAVTAILHEQPRQPSALQSDIPIELENVILRALQKDPNDRFPSAADMQIALEQSLRARGEILTNRDIARYLEDLFSESPTGALVAQSAPIGPAGAYARGGYTMPHESPTPTTLVQETGARPKLDLPDEDAPPRRGAGALVAVVAVMLLLLGATGFGIWSFVIAPRLAETGDGSGSVAAAAPDAAADSVADTAPASEGTGVTAVGGDVGPDAAADGSAAALAAATPDADPAADGSGEGAAAATTEGSVAAIAPDGSGAQADVAVVEPDTAVPGPDTATADAGADDASATTPSEPAVAERPRPRSGPGTVRIVLSTGGRGTVYVDGSQVGSFAGSRSYEVPSGTRQVRVVHSSGAEQTRRVTVEAGRSQTLTFSF